MPWCSVHQFQRADEAFAQHQRDGDKAAVLVVHQLGFDGIWGGYVWHEQRLFVAGNPPANALSHAICAARICQRQHISRVPDPTALVQHPVSLVEQADFPGIYGDVFANDRQDCLEHLLHAQARVHRFANFRNNLHGCRHV